MALAGADIEQLNALATSLDRGASRVQILTRMIDGAVQTLPATWRGPDGAEFANRWRSQFRPQMALASQALLDASATASANASAQEQTSSVDASPFAGAHASGQADLGPGLGVSGSINIGGSWWNPIDYFSPKTPLANALVSTLLPGGGLGGPNVVPPQVADAIGDFVDWLDDADGTVRGGRRQDLITGRDGGRGWLDFGPIDLNSDAQGREILDHYLTGGGDALIIEDDPAWTDYMSNQLGTSDRGIPFDDQVVNEIGTNCDFLESCNGSFHAETANGEGITGENYLHGVNDDLGGLEYEVVGVTRADDGSIVVDTRLTWNDRIDANYQYGSDIVKNGFAEVITLGRAESYDLHITWNEQFVIEP